MEVVYHVAQFDMKKTQKIEASNDEQQNLEIFLFLPPVAAAPYPHKLLAKLPRSVIHIQA